MFKKNLRQKDEKGMILITVILGSLVIFGLLAAIMLSSQSNLQQSHRNQQYAQALAIASEGIENGMWSIVNVADRKPTQNNRVEEWETCSLTGKGEYKVRAEWLHSIQVGVGQAKFEAIEVVNRLARPNWIWTGSGGDFDEDGDCDFVVGGQKNVMEFLPNITHDGNFATETFRTIQASGTKEEDGRRRDIKGMSPAFDFNGDGHLDVVNYEAIFTENGRTMHTANYRLWTGDGNGSFTKGAAFGSITNTESADFWNRVIAAGNVDSGTSTDLVVADIDGKFRVYTNNGKGTFTLKQTIDGWSEEEWANTAGLADFDGDGDLDLIGGSVCDDKEYKLWENINGTFIKRIETIKMPDYGTVSTPIEAYSDASGADGMYIADFDRDGDVDVVVGTDNWRADSRDKRPGDHRGNGGKVYYFENQSSSTNPFTFAPVHTFQNPTGTYSYRGDVYQNPYRFSVDLDSGAAGDFDGDGFIDFMIADTNHSENAYFFRNLTGSGGGEGEETLIRIISTAEVPTTILGGLLGKVKREVSVIVRVPAPGPPGGALISNGSLNLTGNLSTDSYDSRTTVILPTEPTNDNHNKGHIVSNGNITLGGSLAIHGNAYSFSSFTGGSHLYEGGLAIPLSQRFIMPAAKVTPNVDTNHDLGEINRNQVLNGGETYVTSGINLSGNDTITISGNGTVKLYVTGDINVTGNATINENGNPTQLFIYGTNQCLQIREHGGAIIRAAIHAPNATFDPQGTGDLYGSIIVNRVDTGGTGNFTIFYDEALGDTDWLELDKVQIVPGTWHEKQR